MSKGRFSFSSSRPDRNLISAASEALNQNLKYLARLLTFLKLLYALQWQCTFLSHKFRAVHPSIPPKGLAKQPDFEYMGGGSLHAQAVDIAQLLHHCVSATPI